MSSHADTIRPEDEAMLLAFIETLPRYTAQAVLVPEDALVALLTAFRQACTNLATIRPSGIEGATLGDDADRYHDALLAGWGGIEGWDSREALAGDTK